MPGERIDGLDGVLAKLKSLEGKAAKKIVRHSLRAGAKPLRNEMKRNARKFDDPATSEAVYKQIATRSIPKRTLKRFDFDEGVSTGVKDSKPGQPYHYGLFLERGTAHMPAQPFIRNSADNTRTEVFTAVSDDLWDGITKQVSAKGK